jgi:hypothetical protein
MDSSLSTRTEFALASSSNTQKKDGGLNPKIFFTVIAMIVLIHSEDVTLQNVTFETFTSIV